MKQHRTRAFTLMELLVTIGVIALIATVAVPSIWNIFSAGSGAQAYNLMAAQLTAARAEAIQSERYAGVHGQFAADGRAYYTAIVRHAGGSDGQFGGAADYLPRRIPGSMTFGELPRPANVSGEINAGSAFDEFTSWTVLFSPAGAVVRQTPRSDGQVMFGPGDALFTAVAGQRPKLWDAGVANAGGGGEAPVGAVMLFDYAEMRKAADAATWLDANAEWLPLNVHTGQLISR